MKKFLKRSMALILALICAMSLGVTSFAMTDIAMPTSGTCGANGSNLKWYFDENASTLTIKGKGKMADFEYPGEGAPWSGIEVTSIIIEDGVTYIGSRAFFSCGVKEITIPDSVTGLGESIFHHFSSLESIYFLGDAGDWCEFDTDADPFPDNARLYFGKDKTPLAGKLVIPEGTKKIRKAAFSKMTGIQEVVIPEGVREIDFNAFNGCTGIKKLTLPASLRKIGSSAFNLCSNLTETVFEGTLKDWCNIELEDEWASPIFNHGWMNGGYLYINGAKVEGEIVIPEGVREIKDYTFENYHAITGVKIPDGVSRIGKNAFYFCKNLAKAEIAGTVTEIGEWAFKNCYSLETIVIPQGVKKIGSDAFYGADCTCIYLPKSVETIEKDAFGCMNYLDTVHYAGTKDEFANIFIESGNGRLGAEELMHYESWVALTDPSYVAVMPDWAKEPIEEEVWYEEDAEADTDAITEEFADSTEDSENTNSENNDEKDTKVIVIFAVSVLGVLIAAAGIVTVVVLKKKKNS